VLPFTNSARIFKLCALPGSARHCCTGPLCEVPIKPSLIGQSVMTRIVVSKMPLVTSLLTTSEICE
ncbi:unnamed protein product, partial [Staurois parvus]